MGVTFVTRVTTSTTTTGARSVTWVRRIGRRRVVDRVDTQMENRTTKGIAVVWPNSSAKTARPGAATTTSFF